MSRVTAELRRAWPLLAPCVILILAWLALQPGSLVVKRELTLGLIFVVLVVGYYSFAGLSGILSFGHMSFAAIGAYVTALITIPVALKATLLPDLPGWLADLEMSPLLALIVAGAAAALFAAVLSVPLMRLTGIAAALAMFAVLLVVYDVAGNWEAVTRGRQAIIGVPTNTTSSVALIAALAAVTTVFFFQRSRLGLLLRAARDDEVVARASGVDVVNARRVAFVLSAFIIGAGGFLYAQFLGTFTPDSFYIQITFLTIAMLVVGGQHSLAGAVVGASIYSFASAILLRFESGTSIGPLSIDVAPGLREVGLALVLLLILVFRPEGLTRGREFTWRRSRLLGGEP